MKRQMGIGFGIVAVVIVILLTMTAMAPAGPNIKERGKLEAVEEGGKVVVITMGDHKGAYQMSSLAIILNGFGKKTTLDTFPVPTPVAFEVEYTENGPIIKRIEMLPQ
jgi:hypothetical protein